jgi:chromate transporter
MPLPPLAPAEPTDPPAAVPRPDSPTALFWAFSRLALQGFGGVYAVAQHELVERKRWLTREAFVEDWAVAQVLPGPNVVNLSLMFGDRLFGLRGALAAVGGLMCFPLLLLLALTVAFNQVQHLAAAQGALRGMGAVAAGLIVTTALKLVSALRRNALGRSAGALVAVAGFALVALWRVPLPWVLLTVGLPACLLAAWRLGKAEAARARSQTDAARSAGHDGGAT